MANLFFPITPFPLKRWLALLCVVVFLHLFLVHWAVSYLVHPLSRNITPTSITVELQPLPAPFEMQAPPQPKIVTLKHVTTTVAAKNQPKSTPAPTDHKMLSPKSKGLNDADIKPTVSPDSVATSASKTKQSGRDLPIYPIKAAPSAELKYQLYSLRGIQQDTGIGLIFWKNNNIAYQLRGELELQNAKVLSFTSEGPINQYGLSPITFVERRDNKDETNTTFHRENNNIHFSASKEAFPRLGGEQDVASAIWQLAGIARQDTDAIKTGAKFQMFVAGARNADVWLIHVVGLEEIETALGKLRAWHLVRAAPMGSDEQTVDIWLSPDKEWYPVKLRYTEANGDYLDLSVSEITPISDT